MEKGEEGLPSREKLSARATVHGNWKRNLSVISSSAEVTMTWLGEVV